MLAELQYMRTISRKYRKLHIVIRFTVLMSISTIFFELSNQRMAIL